MNKISIAISVAALLMYGCSDKPKEQESNATQTTTQAAPQELYGTSTQTAHTQAPAGANVQTNSQHVATVLETVDAGGYTYVKVDEDGTLYWAAGPKASVQVGAKVSFIEQMVMKDFTSKALNKTFDYLVFASALVPANKSANDASAPQVMQNSNHSGCKDCESKTPQTMHQSAPISQQEAIESVKVAKNAKGYSVEELYTKKAELKDKSILVNATVVKVSKNIMGKDWVHLQDGSGGVDAGTNDIIATSANSTVKVGDRVTASGIVKTDVDLGYGYKFAVMVEQAKFSSL